MNPLTNHKQLPMSLLIPERNTESPTWVLSDLLSGISSLKDKTNTLLWPRQMI